ncbi:MAG: hypothetical protein Q9M97_05795 [Candidatus Gracilibacteria bacterium]|nr:hypothetical protein [Candidatus Gracilibacteria bacterium]
MIKTIKKTKSWLVVLDSGFKGAEMCKNIFENCKKHFLVRISATQVFFDEKGEKFKISELLKRKMLFILKMVKCGYLKVYFCKVGIKNDSKKE